MEFVVAEIERSVDGTEGLEGVRHLLLLSIVIQTCSAVHNKTIWRYLIEPAGESHTQSLQLQLLLSRGDSTQYRQTIHTRLDIGGCTILGR